MTGCSDCSAADRVLETKQVKNNFNITKLYYKNEVNDKEYIDYHDMFLNVFNIEWYPSFLILKSDNSYQFIGETSVENLQDVLMNSIN